MPELPEVETTKRILKKVLIGRKILDIWCDTKKLIKKPDFKTFQKEIKGKEIKDIKRKGKILLFYLSQDKILLIHQKLTGHLLFGKWKREKNQWIPPKGPLEEKINKFLHLIFFLDNGKMLALSDLRKFAKVELWEKEKLEQSQEIKELGPDPLDKNFTFNEFKKRIATQKRKIKEVLMDQKIIAGIGNIYSDEILWVSKIHPFKKANTLSEKELLLIFNKMREILLKAIQLKGESISDYRTPSGEKGGFDVERKVYRREREKCLRCGGVIQRKKLGGRSTYFCPQCQKL